MLQQDPLAWSTEFQSTSKANINILVLDWSFLKISTALFEELLHKNWKMFVKVQGKSSWEQLISSYSASGLWSKQLKLVPLGEFCLQISEVVLACVTEQTHEIRVYGLCDGARFAVPWRQIFPENSGKIRYYNWCNAPCFVASGHRYLQYFFSLPTKSLTAVGNHCKCN